MLRFLWSRRVAAILTTATVFKQHKNIINNFKKKNFSYNTKQTFILSSTGLLAVLTQLLFNKENDDAIVLLIKRGILAQSRKQYIEAEDFFHDAIKLFDKLNAEKPLNPVYRVNIYLYLANLYYEARFYEKSFRLFQECLRELIVNLNYERNHEAVIEISLKLSNIFAYGLNSIHDAKVGYEFCIEAILTRIKEYETKQPEDEVLKLKLEKSLINAKVFYIMILHTYGLYLLNLKENSQALSLLEQAKILALQLHQRDKVSNQQLGTLLNDLALAYHGKSKYNDAIEVLNQALELLNSELNKIEMNKDENEIEIYNREKFDLNECKLVNLSNLCSSFYSLKEYERAKESCTNAIKLFNKNNFTQNLITNDLVSEINEIKKLLNDINGELKKNGG